MITNFKIFENYTNKPKYNIGDYVQVESDIMRIIDIVTIEHEGRNVYQYECIFIEDEEYASNGLDVDYQFNIEDFIIRKLTPEEVELYKATNKYNL